MKNIEETLLIIKPEAIERKLVGEIISRIEKADLTIDAMILTKPDRRTIERHYPDDIRWKIRVGNKVLNAFVESELPDKHIEGLDTATLGDNVRNYSIQSLVDREIIVCKLSGVDAIRRVKKIVGEGSNILKCSQGTIRGDYASDSILKANLEGRAIRNLAHRSSNPEEAEREINLWFGHLRNS